MRQTIDWVLSLLVRAFFAVLGRLPRRIALHLCRRIADVFFYLDAKHRRIGLINLEIAFPERSFAWRRQVLRDSFRQLGTLAVELARFPRVPAEELRRRFQYEEGFGLEHFEQARQVAAEQGKGILFVTAHISVWEILPAAHAVHAHPLSFVVRPLDNPFLEAWLNRIRSRFGNQTLPKKQAMRHILKALSDGRDVGFLIDQNVLRKEGIYVPLFGRPACTTPAVSALALRTGLPVVCGFVYPVDDNGNFRIRFYPPVCFTRSGDEERDLYQATARLNQTIESVIREFPHCWLWGHRRFRSQPDDSDPYRGPA